MMKYGPQPLERRPTPLQLPSIGARVRTKRQLKFLLHQEAQYRVDRSHLIERIKDQMNHRSHLFIGIQHELPNR